MSASALLPAPCCVVCGCFLASDTVRAGADLCPPCRGTNALPLSVDDLLELRKLGLLSESPRAVLGLDPERYFDCGHPRTAENTLFERRGNGRVRERCRTCKTRDEAKRDRRQAA